MSRPVVVGIAGGSASGKSTVVDEFVHQLRPSPAAVLRHDAYYRDLSHMDLAARRAVNVDHPDSLETELLLEHLDRLLSGEPVAMPVYDFAEQIRRPDTVLIRPAPVLVVDGILVLSEERLRARMDFKVYVEVPEEERLARRIRRDTRSRGKTPEEVRKDHEYRVQPMHVRFVEPSRRWADLVVAGGGRNREGVQELVSAVERLRRRESTSLE